MTSPGYKTLDSTDTWSSPRYTCDAPIKHQPLKCCHDLRRYFITPTMPYQLISYYNYFFFRAKVVPKSLHCFPPGPLWVNSWRTFLSTVQCTGLFPSSEPVQIFRVFAINLLWSAIVFAKRCPAKWSEIESFAIKKGCLPFCNRPAQPDAGSSR